jgi:hypothetical protein
MYSEFVFLLRHRLDSAGGFCLSLLWNGGIGFSFVSLNTWGLCVLAFNSVNSWLFAYMITPFL